MIGRWRLFLVVTAVLLTGVGLLRSGRPQSAVREVVVRHAEAEAACMPAPFSRGNWDFGGAVVEECPGLPRPEYISAGFNKKNIAPFPALPSGRRTKALFLTTHYYYTNIMSRWYFHLHEAARTLPQWDVTLWGPGFPLYNRYCNCVGDSSVFGAVSAGAQHLRGAEKAEDIVACDVGLNEGLRVPLHISLDPSYETDDVEGDSIARAVNEADEKRCGLVQKMTFNEQIEFLFNATDEPFDIIFVSWPFGARSRDDYFAGLPEETVIALFDHEWHGWSLNQVRITKPNLIFHPYIDNFEENYAVRQFALSLDKDDPRRSAFLPSNWTFVPSEPPPELRPKPRSPRSANDVQKESDYQKKKVQEKKKNEKKKKNKEQRTNSEPKQRKLLETAGNDTSSANFSDFAPDFLVGFAPLGVLPHCHTRWEEYLFHTMPTSTRKRRPSRQNRPLDLFFVGLTSARNYPTRAILQEVKKENYSDLARRIYQLGHPGYTEVGNSRGHKNCTQRLENRDSEYGKYLNLMEQSKVCFIGIISTWSIRKYKEAMASGCLVVGDRPADGHLSEFIVDLNVTWPGTLNFDVAKDVAAVELLTGETFKGVDTRSPEKIVGFVPPMMDMYEDVKNATLVSQAGKEVAKRLVEILEAYGRGEYDDLIKRAQFAAVRDYSWQSTLTEWVLPAVEAYKRGERGWFRPSKYFSKYSAKYDVRHKYLLAEWLLRQGGMGEAEAAASPEVQIERRKMMKRLMATPATDVIQQAQKALKARNDLVCARDGNLHLGKASPLTECLSEAFLYFDGLADFEAKFVKARELYMQGYPLDRFSNRYHYHIPSLYPATNKA